MTNTSRRGQLIALWASLAAAALPAVATAEPSKPPPGSSAAPAPTRSIVTPSQRPAPMQVDGSKTLQPRALPPAPPSPRKPDPNSGSETTGQAATPASPPPKAADGKR